MKTIVQSKKLLLFLLWHHSSALTAQRISGIIYAPGKSIKLEVFHTRHSAIAVTQSYWLCSTIFFLINLLSVSLNNLRPSILKFNVDTKYFFSLAMARCSNCTKGTCS